MSTLVMVSCDFAYPDGACAARLMGSLDAAELAVALHRAGWFFLGRNGHYCPRHGGLS